MPRSRNPERDAKILQDVASGLREEDVARLNGVSVYTVRRILYQKPGVITAKALRAGIRSSWNAREQD